MINTPTSKAGLYYCPTAGEVEHPTQGGFDVCCDRPELHKPVCVHGVLMTDGCVKCGRTISRRGTRVHREHGGLCTGGICFEDDFTDDCDCWCHDGKERS